MPQIRTAFSDAEFSLIDDRRGGLARGVWARAQLAEALDYMPPPVPALPDAGPRSRLAINVTDEVKEETESRAGDVPVAQWVRDAILRRLWAGGARW